MQITQADVTSKRVYLLGVEVCLCAYMSTWRSEVFTASAISAAIYGVLTALKANSLRKGKRMETVTWLAAVAALFALISKIGAWRHL